MQFLALWQFSSIQVNYLAQSRQQAHLIGNKIAILIFINKDMLLYSESFPWPLTQSCGALRYCCLNRPAPMIPNPTPPSTVLSSNLTPFPQP